MLEDIGTISLLTGVNLLMFLTLYFAITRAADLVDRFSRSEGGTDER